MKRVEYGNDEREYGYVKLRALTRGMEECSFLFLVIFHRPFVGLFCARFS